MKVYIVLYRTTYEVGKDVEKLFLSKEKADKFAAAKNRNADEYAEYYVQEFDVEE